MTGSFPTLETERLLLREIGTDDAPDLLAIHGDAEAMRWFGNEPIKDLRAATGLVHAFASWRRTGTGTRWGIERREDGRFLGSCGLFDWDRDAGKCSVGYELGVHAWGKGYMQEALAAVLSWGFGPMQLHRIEAFIHPLNEASLQLARRIGFVEEGRLRDAACWGGQRHDMLLLSLLKTEYAPKQRSGGRLRREAAEPSGWRPLVQWVCQLAGQL